MPKTSFGIKGSPNVEYNLDELEQDNRLNSKKELVIQVWKYNPNASDPVKRNPNPPDLKIGQIWLSKLVDLIELEGDK